MEMSCDEAAVGILGDDVKKEYSASLLAIASGRRIRLTTPLAFGEGETGSRIKNVLRYKKPTQVVIGIALIVCIAVIVTLAANPGNPDGTVDTDNAGDFAGEVFYGIVCYVNTGEEETADGEVKVVTIPGIGEVAIPAADEVYPYIEIEKFTEPEAGDLLAITFPAGQEVFIQETYPVKTEALSVDIDNYDIWVELSAEEVRTFLANFGHGIECEIE